MVATRRARRRLSQWPQQAVRTASERARANLRTSGSHQLDNGAWTWIAIGATLVVFGMLLFTNVQAQEVFRQAGEAVGGSRIERNDGGLVFFAAVAGLGTAIILGALSNRPRIERLGPMAGVGAAVASLLALHFSIYVNGFTIPGSQFSSLSASFLFKDASNALPIAVFILALVTLLLLYGAAYGTMALVVPHILNGSFRRPTTTTQHRTRTVLTALVTLASGAAFARQFFLYAVHNDADPTGAFPTMNLVVVYYLLGILLVGVLALTAWRTYVSVWGDLRDKRSKSFRRGLAYLLNAETWLWALMGLLTLAIAASSPISTPRGVDRVFAMNSKGTSLFFLLVFGLYVLHRSAARDYVHHLHDEVARNPHARAYAGLDALFWVAAASTGIWLTTSVVFLATDLSPLARLTIRTCLVALVLPFFAVRFDFQDLERPGLRNTGSPLVLLFAGVLSILAGLMLWGTGNSVTTMYSAQSGGFIQPEGSVLQPYAVGIRILGSLFIATPLTLTLWYLATRFEHPFNPGPLIVVGFSVILAMNTLLTINAGGEYDPALRQTEVIIGFSFVALADAATKVTLMLGWAAVAGVGIIAAALLLHRGADHSVRPNETWDPHMERAAA